MGKMKDIAILISEYAESNKEDFDYLETLSETDFKLHPLALKLAEDLGISIDLLSSGFMHDVE